jgi:hypothetical protein
MGEGATCQDTERNRPSEGRSRPGDSRGRDLSRYGRNPTERAALTAWRRHREGLVRTRKEINKPRRTHKLETAGGGTCQDRERNRRTEAHSRSGDSGWRDLSGHRKQQAEQGALTNWGRQMDGLVRTRKESDRAMCTHGLETAEREGLVRTQKEINEPRRTHKLETTSGVTCQDRERNRRIQAHSRSGDSGWRDLSGHRKQQAEQGALTNWIWQMEGLVRTRKESERAKDTHTLETGEGGTCQNTEKNRPSEAHSLPGDGR